MPVYKTFLKIAKKRLPSSIMYFGIFFILMFILSSVANRNAAASSFEASSYDICIVDEDKTDASQALYDYMASIHNPIELRATDSETLQDNLYYHIISYVLIIPEGFEDKLEAGDYENLLESSKRHDSASGYFIDQQIDQYLNSVKLYLSGGYNVTEAFEMTDSTLDSLEDVEIINFEATSKNSDSAMYYFFQYIPYVLTILLIVSMTPILITFNRKDLGNRINCSSMSLTSKNAQITLGCLTHSFFLWTIFLIGALIFYGPSMVFSSNGLLCILNSLVFLMIAIAITLFISCFSPSDNVLNMIANVVSLGMSFICGIFVPMWLLGDSVVAASRFLPAYWYMRIINMLNGMSGEEMSMQTYWMCIGMQVIFFAAIFALFLVASKQRKRGHAQ